MYAVKYANEIAVGLMKHKISKWTGLVLLHQLISRMHFVLLRYLAVM